MHERSLVKALLQQVEAIAIDHARSRVVSIHVCVGEFSGIEADLFVSAYEDLVENTSLADARLYVERATLRAACDRCGNEFRIEKFCFQCDRCGSLDLAICGGEELMLKSVKLQETEAWIPTN
jgi:hydrogenase nickel incorporation protein HypA/HybF